MKISPEAKRKAVDFLENETQFHLGILPTEQSNPKTKDLDKVFNRSISSGIKMLFTVDEDIAPMAKRIFESREFALMLDESYRAIVNGGKVVFSGCGATGRLSILLESMWRTFFRKLENNDKKTFEKVKKFENRVFSIMTGGDYTLIQSVESFEDYPQFGRCQARALNLNEKDVLIAISEGGETSSVLGTIGLALEVNAKVFFMFNNPADILCKHIQRSREVIENPKVTILDLYCGPMAIAGSTRMQATSSEQLIAGAMLEKLLNKIFDNHCGQGCFPGADINYAKEMRRLVAGLKQQASVEAIAEHIKLETQIYKKNGLVTYFADEFLLDVFTDTTERSPTFMTPLFRKYTDKSLPPSWAFVKTPLYSTADAWTHYLGRNLRCLQWNQSDYLKMNAPEWITKNPPKLKDEDMFQFLIGNEPEEVRFACNKNVAVCIFSAGELSDELLAASRKCTKPFARHHNLIIGDTLNPPRNALIIPGNVKPGSLKLMEHMKIKLILNTISTGTMICLGRVKSNWMSYASMSNKKLVDRCIRLIAELGGRSYEEACFALHQSIEELEKIDFSNEQPPSPVQYTLAKKDPSHFGVAVKLRLGKYVTDPGNQ